MISPPKLFGTDGIRGAFGQAPLDESSVRSLGAALAIDLVDRFTPPWVVLGGDTRDSTATLCSWLAAELEARGIGVTYLGTVPTPCVTTITVQSGASCGVVVSASHNPHPDNGIKLIDDAGFKWSRTAEARLEDLMAEQPPTAGGEGTLLLDEESRQTYFDHLIAGLDGQRLDGLRIALDFGNGAATPMARGLFESLGAQVFATGDQPDGRNINAGCGSTHPENVAALTQEHGCDLGFSFDGDADRVILADELGQVRDGDAVLYLWGRALKAKNALTGDRLVATSMSNLGLVVALEKHGIGVERCDVGDRIVVETLRQQGLLLGGEQSGHIVHLGLGTTGDGIGTALHMAALRARSAQPLSQSLADFERFPQLLKNLVVSHKPPLDSLPGVVEASRQIEKKLGNEGRLVLRYSGTEQKVRIMIEGRNRKEIEAMADDLAAVLTEELS